MNDQPFNQYAEIDKWFEKYMRAVKGVYRLRSTLEQIAYSVDWGEDSAIKREIQRLQALARAALAPETETT